MSSRLLTSLEARIAQTRDPLQAACLRAERATLLARQGHLEEARTELNAIRARFDSRPNAVVSAWVCLGEGLVIYFSCLGKQARDKIKRAVALSEAVKARPLQALSSAWLAQMDFSSLDFEPLLIHLPMALRSAEPGQHPALSRACLVAAEAFHWSERFDLALPWYVRARHHATAEGDEPTLSALMHNMAWLKVAEARRRDAAGVPDSEHARDALVSADSTYRFDEMFRVEALGSLVPILQGQVLLLNERHAEALRILESNMDEFVQQGLGRMSCVLLADVALCRLHAGDESGARRDVDRAVLGLTKETHVDDRAMTHERAAHICRALGDARAEAAHRQQADEAWVAHVARQRKLIPALSAALAEF